VCALPAEAVVPPHVLGTASDKTLVFDVNYRRARSPVAEMAGRRRSDGLPLLVHQGALSFEWWTGRAAPLDVMRAAVSAGSV
jgi:shikimate dehydrogenase